ncbi:hypothetical protein QAD02_000779 [Eretmocerus hayati]|uniref:Uncharacterized protein n=1 Tax=Eretmocerus hayati TaxID=131215 RepID=A0ACC2NE89_9HYME|nr:hypothetical protein QAD02_000779 [Eretmocerus hayati]
MEGLINRSMPQALDMPLLGNPTIPVAVVEITQDGNATFKLQDLPNSKFSWGDKEDWQQLNIQSDQYQGPLQESTMNVNSVEEKEEQVPEVPNDEKEEMNAVSIQFSSCLIIN